MTPTNAMAITKSPTKIMNLAKLCFPTQFLIQVQWWSNWGMHTPHLSQWLERRGFFLTH